MLVVTNWNMRHVEPPREIRNQVHPKPIVESHLSLVEQANDRTNSKLSLGLLEPGVNYGFSILAFAVLVSVWVFVRRQVAA